MLESIRCGITFDGKEIKNDYQLYRFTGAASGECSMQQSSGRFPSNVRSAKSTQIHMFGENDDNWVAFGDKETSEKIDKTVNDEKLNEML